MKKLFCCLLLLCFLLHAGATSIVVVVTPKYILIGTDSKRQTLNATAHVAAEQTVQKIQFAGPYCFALAGFTSASATGFAPGAVVARHLQQAPNYTVAIQGIKKEIKTALQKQLSYQRTHEPEAFSRLTTAQEPLLEVVVLSMQEGKPQMELIGFELNARNGIAVSSYTARCPGDCPTGAEQVYLLGAYGGMEPYLAGRRRPGTPPAEWVESLILEQAKATPTAVGVPVHLVRFSALGAECLK